MPNELVGSQLVYFPDPTQGRPLYNGYVYVGEPDTDPTSSANQKQVSIIQENGTEVEVSQPLRTNAGGVLTYEGSVVRAIVDGAYSLAVQNKSRSQVYYMANSEINPEAPANGSESDFNRWRTQTAAYIADRGVSSAAPENTTNSLRLAGDSGYWGSVFSARLTIDEAWVLMYDETVDRTTNGTGAVSGLTLAAIQALDAGSWFDPYYTNAIVPTVQEALILCRETNQSPIVDIRGTGYTDSQLQSLINICEAQYPNRGYLIQSGDIGTLTQLRTLSADIPLMYLTASYSNSAVDECLTLTKCDLSAPFSTISEIDYAKLNDVSVLATSVEFMADFDEMASFGCVGITSTRLRQSDTPRGKFSIDANRLDWTSLGGANAADNAAFIVDDTGTDFLLNSFTTDETFIQLWVPGELPVGARVEVSCDIRYVAGANMSLFLDTFADGAYGGTDGSGGTTEALAFSQTTTEYRKVVTSFHVKPGQQYIRAGVGYRAPDVGSGYIRNLKVTIDGADSKKHHPENIVITENQTFNAKDFGLQFFEDEVAPGSINITADSVSFQAPTVASIAQIFTSSSLSQPARRDQGIYDIEGSKGIQITVDGESSGSSAGMVAIDLFDEFNALLATMKCFFHVNSGVSKFWFPPIPGAVYALPRFGMDDTGTLQSVFTVNRIRYSLLDSMSRNKGQSINYFSARFVKIGGVWELFNETVNDVRYKDNGVGQFFVNSNFFQIELADDFVSTPTCTAEFHNNVIATDIYNAKVIDTDSTNDRNILVSVYDSTTGAIVDLTAVPDNCVMTVHGVSFR